MSLLWVQGKAPDERQRKSETCRVLFVNAVCTVENSWWWTQELSEKCRVLSLPCVQWKIPDDGHRNCPKHVEFYLSLLCVQWKTPDDVQRNCPKHVEFYLSMPCVQWKTPDDGQRNCPKHVEFYLSMPCVQWKTPDDGQRNCPKHVEFYSKNNFEKLVHLVGFIVWNLSRCTVTWISNYPTDIRLNQIRCGKSERTTLPSVLRVMQGRREPFIQF